WRSNPRFRFIFQSDDETAAEPSNCYILSFTNARYVQLSKRSSRSGLEQIGTFSNIPELQSKEKIRLELLVDRKTGLIRLLVNGNVAADWTDPTPDPGSGPGAFHFNSQDPSPIRISRLEVTTWDGILEGSAPNEEEGPGEDD